MLRRFWFLPLLVAALSWGCQKEPENVRITATTKPEAVVQLTVLVIDDQDLAAGIELLRGEWAERGNGQIEVEQWTKEQWTKKQAGEDKRLPADLVIYPSRFIGTLVDQNWIRPVRESVLQSTALALNDLFPLVRNVTLPYDNRVYALSLGEAPLMLASPHDLQDLRLTGTWEQANLLLDAKMGGLQYPYACELLARGLAASQQNGQIAGLFDPQSFQPLITQPHFVRALAQMASTGNSSVGQSLDRWTISLPNRALIGRSINADGARLTAFAAMPKSERVFNRTRERWESNDSANSTTMLGFSGRSMSVTRSTRNSASAFQLLAWLASETISTQISPRSAATAWSRRSQIPKAGKWLTDEANQSDAAAVVSKMLASKQYFLLPRIPGIDEYLGSLDAAIGRFAAGEGVEGSRAERIDERPALQTLRDVTAEWNAITNRYGRDRQRVAYRKHLGFADP